MVKLKWAGKMVSVNCTESELAEALAMDDEIMLGCWLGAVGEIGHEAAMMVAREYAEELMEG